MPDVAAPDGQDTWGLHAFVLTDIESSTRRWETNTEAMAQDLAHHDRLAEEVMEGAGGSEVKGLGDGFLFEFGDSLSALRGSIELQERLATTDWPNNPLAVRIGVHVGGAQERAGDYFGPTLGRCARVMGAAVGGQILVTREVVADVAKDPELAGRLHHHGPCMLRDLGEPVEIWEVLHEHRREPSPPVALGEGLNNLPVGFSSFVGRSEEMHEVAERVRQQPLVTLTGSGGVGKTRLALQVAARMSDEFTHGVWLVALDGVERDDEVAEKVLSNLGLRQVGGVSDLQRLRSAITGRNMMLLMDCCEHVIDGVREVVEAVGGGRMRVLATSRRPVGVPGEVVWRVRSLSADPQPLLRGGTRRSEAVTLLHHRASERDHPLDLDDPRNAEAAERLVRRLDGIPLAIELAAARLAVLDVVGLDEKLADGLPLGDDRTQRPPRHRTIDATIEWSDRLLSEPARLLLRRMCVFAAPPDLESLDEVCGDGLGAPVVDMITELVDASLASTVDRGGSRRFVTLDSVDAYADSRWSEDDRRSTLVRYAQWAARLAAAGGPMVLLDAGWLERLQAVDDDMTRAIGWLFENDPGRAVAMAGDLAVYWALSGHAHEGREWLGRALEAPVDVEPIELASLLEGGGMAAALDADYARSTELLTASSEQFRALGRTRRAAYPSFWQARSTIVLAYQGVADAYELDLAAEQLASVLADFETHGDLLGHALALPYEGWARMLAGKPDASEPCRRSLEIAEASGVALVAAYARAHLAHVLLVDSDDVAGAAELLGQAMAELRSSGDRQNLLICLLLQAAIELRRGHGPAATTTAGEAASIASRGGGREWEPATLGVGWAVHVNGDRGLASMIEGHLEAKLPSWRTMLANTGLAPMIEELAAAIGTEDELVRRTACASGRRMGADQLLRLVSSASATQAR